MEVSGNRGTPRSSISIGFSIVNHPFWGTNISGNSCVYMVISHKSALYTHIKSMKPISALVKSSSF